MVGLPLFFGKAFAERFHYTPGGEKAARTISTKKCQNPPAKHRICWKKKFWPSFGLNPVFECGILFLLWKSSGAVCRAQQRGKGNER
jgi:hypothetical protein